MEKELIPKLRFPEFENNWEPRTIKDLFTFKITNSFSRENLNYSEGDVYNIHYGDIHTKFQTLLDINVETLPYINKDINLNKVVPENYCKEGDLILADASEDLNDVGKSVEIIKIGRKKVLAGLHTILARPNQNVFTIGFCGYLFKSPTVRKLIQNEAQGTKVLSISATRISKIQISIPDKQEQQKIASFLTTVDTKLQALKKKKELLEQYKKGVMQKIFSQELRFKNEDGKEFPEWKYFQGGDLFEAISDKEHNSDLPILAISQEYGAVPREFINYQISVTEKSVESYKVVKKGDFIISLRSFQGGIEYSNYDGICSPAYIILRPKKLINDLFYKYYFKTPEYIKQLCSKLEGIRDGKMISYKYFSETILPFPQIDEQKQISDFYLILENKLDQISKNIQNIENWKKGLIQKMFC